jgi:valine--pyruvate aminotransferase
MSPHSWSEKYSLIGRKLTARSGILELMDDLGRAMTVEPDMRMLAGGNPAAVPEMQAVIHERMQEFMDEAGAFERMIGNYDPPQGNPIFIEAMADLLRDEFGWDVGPENIAVTNGTQSASFYLLNLLAGSCGDGKRKRILLPQTPEYIGYADQGLEPDMFVACRPKIERPEGPDSPVFKYRIDFDAVEDVLDCGEIGVVAVSRPTNPTGNVLSDEEVQRLSDLTAKHAVPLIIDGAYGMPFPNVTFIPAKPHWAPHVILLLSLSKLGLPGSRTGIVVAPQEIAAAMSSFTAIVGLANGTLGQQIVLPWVKDHRILEFGPKIIRPFYEEKSLVAFGWASEYFGTNGVDWSVHASEGAFFHWFWFPSLRISTRELHERLKQRKVLTVPGEYFFYGLEEEWSHSDECLRVNYSGPPETVRVGLRIIAEEAAKWQRSR